MTTGVTFPPAPPPPLPPSPPNSVKPSTHQKILVQQTSYPVTPPLPPSPPNSIKPSTHQKILVHQTSHPVTPPPLPPSSRTHYINKSRRGWDTKARSGINGITVVVHNTGGRLFELPGRDESEDETEEEEESEDD